MGDRRFDGLSPIDIRTAFGYNKPNTVRKEDGAMFHKGLSREALVDAAKRLVEESGAAAFSMRTLAEKLGVKAASLYAHIESMDALFTEVGLSALNDQKAAQLCAVQGKSRDQAVMALADSYRAFAKEHSELYRLIMQMPMGTNEALKTAAAMTAEPAMRVLADYRIREERRMHWQRVLRGVMHGFVSQEAAGYFSHYPVELEESYHLAVQCIIDGLHGEEASNE
ncbi:MAG: TetR/AcrR family transcriptional regulator [Clostridia bacterium]|nr:TetR/AcrR family transcriptional regulator [Clostridia bacterium]